MKREEIKEKFNKWFVDNYGTDFTSKHEELDEDDVIDFVQALTIPVVVERLPIGEVIKLIDNEDFKGFTGELKITGHCSYMGKNVGHLVNGEGIFLIEDFVR